MTLKHRRGRSDAAPRGDVAQDKALGTDEAKLARVQQRRAALIVKIDKKLGKQTPQHIIDLAKRKPPSPPGQ